jgi:polysaccharide deacetylase 2 family uncharacterized protein YibQ
MKNLATYFEPLKKLSTRFVPTRSMAMVRSESFRDGFTHGLAICGGGLIGLAAFSMFLAKPATSPYATYSVILPFTVEAQVVIAQHGTKPDAHTSLSAQTEHDGTAPDKLSLPVAGLTEDKPPYGHLPIIRESDNLRPFDAYRQPFASDQLAKPLIAVVMLDYGLSDNASGSILGVMPPEVNLVLSTAAQGTTEWAQKAFDHGHEMWLDLAVETPDYPLSDPGANALLSSAPVERNQAALFTQLGHAVGYAGVFGSYPSPYYTTGADADFISGNIYARGLGLILNTNRADMLMRREADRQKAPFYAGNMVMIDRILDDSAMMAAFTQVEQQARKRGFAFALFHPTPYARKSVLNWMSTLKTKGLAMAPLSVLAERGADLQP